MAAAAAAVQMQGANLVGRMLPSTPEGDLLAVTLKG